MKSGMIRGLVLLGLGAFIIYWAMTHSPKAGVGQMIANEVSGSYTMGETAYYASLGCRCYYWRIGHFWTL